MKWTGLIGASLIGAGLLATALLGGGYGESTYSLLAAATWLGLAVAAALAPLRSPSAAALALAALAAWTAASALWGPDGPALRAAPLAALYAGWLWAAEQLDRQALLRVVWGCSVAVSAVALPCYRGGRLDWPVTYANGLGLVAGAGLLLSLGRRSRLGAAVCGLALVLTFSRSAILATAAGAVVLLAVERRLPLRVALAGAAALAVAAVLLAQPLGARFAAPAPDEQDARRLVDLSGHGRSELWRVAWEQGLEHPLLGGGAGTWARAYVAETGELAAPANAHSLPLETFAELGLVGVALLGAFAVVVLRRARVEPAAAAVLAAWLVHACADWDWQLPAATLPALACAAALTQRPDFQRRLGRAALPLAAVALAVGGLAAAHGVGAALLEEGRPRAAALLLPHDARPWLARGDLERACAVDPGELAIRRHRPSNQGCTRGGRGR
jgi:O-antigen ligase